MSIHDKINLAVSRRNFLIGASLTGAGLVIGLQPSPSSAAEEAFEPNAFIRIPAEGKIVFVMPSVEMGQGVYTSVAMLLAEELEVTLDQVVLEHAPADPKRYANPLLGDQITGGSIAIRGVYAPMRKAGAAARIMLVNAAARGWGVAPETCNAEAGHVVHAASGRRAAYGSLIQAAASEAVPQEMPLKPASSFKLIGQSIRRLDSPEKVNGTAKYGIDARPEGVSYAAIAICPHFGGKLRAVEDGPARAVKGVKQVVRIEDAVAVMADNTGAARKGSRLSPSNGSPARMALFRWLIWRSARKMQLAATLCHTSMWAMLRKRKPNTDLRLSSSTASRSSPIRPWSR